MGIFSLTISLNSFQSAGQHILRKNRKFCDFLRLAKIKEARIMEKWVCVKITGAKIQGEIIKGAQKFEGIR